MSNLITVIVVCTALLGLAMLGCTWIICGVLKDLNDNKLDKVALRVNKMDESLEPIIKAIEEQLKQGGETLAEPNHKLPTLTYL